jgi:hypothetical protein
VLRDILGKGFLYFLSIVFGLGFITRLSLLGAPLWATVLGGVAAGILIGRFLTHDGPKS